jgi:hypothetical protein
MRNATADFVITRDELPNHDACNETNLIHYLSSVYSVTIPLHVSGFLVAHHQEVTMYICNNWYVLYVLDDWPLAWLGWDQAHPNQASVQHVPFVAYIHRYLLMMGN